MGIIGIILYCTLLSNRVAGIFPQNCNSSNCLIHRSIVCEHFQTGKCGWGILWMIWWRNSLYCQLQGWQHGQRWKLEATVKFVSKFWQQSFYTVQFRFCLSHFGSLAAPPFLFAWRPTLGPMTHELHSQSLLTLLKSRGNLSSHTRFLHNPHVPVQNHLDPPDIFLPA